MAKAVVIGSGFGGLAAAVRLLARGFEVEVLERRDAPGGRAYVRRQDGFTFDMGPTIITAPFLFEDLWRLAGRRLEDDVTLKALDPFYRLRFDDGVTFDPPAQPAAMRDLVKARAPDDLAGYDRLIALSEEIYRIGFEGLSDQPFSSWRDMVPIAPKMIALESYRSVWSIVAKHVKDPHLRVALSFHPLFLGGDPFRASSIYCLIAYLERRHGVHAAIGGTGRLVEGLVGLIKGMGGRITYDAEVTEILVREGRAAGVRLGDGETRAADIVVSNADAAWTYRHLVPAAARRVWTNGKIDRAAHSMGLFLWYFGTRRRYADVPHHTILLGPRYRELIRDIFRRRVLAEDFSLYLHRPTATDPSVAPEGCDTFYVLSPVPHLGADIDWSRMAETYRRRVEARLAETILPGLSDAIVTSHVMTPADFERDLLAYRGAAFALEPVLWQSAWFRPHNESEDLKGLYLVGAGTHPGAGVPAVLSSAKILDRIVPDAATFA